MMDYSEEQEKAEIAQNHSLDSGTGSSDKDGDEIVENSGTSSQEATTMDLNMKKITELEQIIENMNTDFGEKRAVFKKLFLAKEKELEDITQEKEELKTIVKKYEDELNDTKSQVTIAEFTKENDIHLEKRRGAEEMANLQKMFEERRIEMCGKYESEIHRLRTLNSKLEGDLNDVRGALANSSEVSPSTVLSAMTKTLARKLNSTMSVSNDSLHDIEEPPPTPKVKSPKYAGEDAEMLRSLVVQLEEELSVLKDKVRSSDDQLAALNSAQASLVKGNETLTDFLQNPTNEKTEILFQIEQKLKDDDGTDAEKSSIADLEMYVALVNAQKTILQEDLEKTKVALKELRVTADEEKKRHDSLKETWKKANEEFVETQEAYESTIHKLKDLMTPKQLQLIKAGELNKDPKPSDSESEKKVECEECEKAKLTIEKLKSDLHKAAKMQLEKEEDWGRISQEFQQKLEELENQMATYEVLLGEVNSSFDQSSNRTDTLLKRISYDRDGLQKRIEAIEIENDNLKGKHVAHSNILQNESISLPNSVMELQEMVLKLKDELICVKIGKEQNEGEYNFLLNRVQMEEAEKKGIEDSLNAEINHLRDLITDQKAKKSRYADELKRQEQVVDNLKKALASTEPLQSKVSSFEKQIEQLTKEKDESLADVNALHEKVSTLHRELGNSEELQKDLIALSKSLQVELEGLRTGNTEVRFQHPDSAALCASCKKAFTSNKDKANCNHCGRVFCGTCLQRTVAQGGRDYKVCGFCHTLLAHDSAPYFSTEPPHSPD